MKHYFQIKQFILKTIFHFDYNENKVVVKEDKIIYSTNLEGKHY